MCHEVAMIMPYWLLNIVFKQWNSIMAIFSHDCQCEMWYGYEVVLIGTHINFKNDTEWNQGFLTYNNE